MKKINNLKQYIQNDRGCATTRPNTYQILRNDAKLSSHSRISLTDKEFKINVQFIHIINNKIGVIIAEQREKQIKLLNKFFKDKGILFSYDESQVKYVDDKRFLKIDKDSIEERNLKSQYRASPERNLNFYTSSLANGLLGWATFPWEMKGNRDMDGVVINYNTLPGGGLKPYNLGMTAVHEIGHWLGLYHTFQGGCDAVGDHVGDTVSHEGPNFGKPDPNQKNGSCDMNNKAPVHNVMNYTDDDWMTEITEQQVNRIKLHLIEYRSDFMI